MKKIIFGFSTTHLPLSWLIRKIQGLDCSHVYIQYTSSCGEELVYEAEGMQTHLVNKKNFVNSSIVVEEYEVEVDQKTFDDIKVFIERDIGVPYGWGELVGLLIKFFIHFISFGKINIKNPFPSKDTICSEAAGHIYIKFLGGYQDVADDDIDIVWIWSRINSDGRFKRIK
jgi:hypothetical protein